MTTSLRVLLVFGAAFVLLEAGCSLAKDADLRAIFAKRKAPMEALVRMAIEDPPMQIIAREFVRPEKSPLSNERLKKYRDLLSESGALSVTKSEDRNEVWIDFSGAGAAFDSTHKGIAYIPHRPADYKVVESLDRQSGDGFYLISIEGPWYVYYLR